MPPLLHATRLLAALLATSAPGPDGLPRVESTLESKSPQIRQLAFDGDPATYFESARDASAADRFTLVLDAPVALRSVSALTGRPDGSGAIESGAIEVSADGSTFETIAEFARGEASARADRPSVKALRIRPSADLKHPLVIREIRVESTPPVPTFAHPVEFRVVVEDAPDLKDWAEGVGSLCEAWYPSVIETLDAEAATPPLEVTMTFTPGYDGVAAAGGGEIVGSTRYFRAHLRDRGALVHETVHIVQHYPGQEDPGWLVEGIADYVRFFLFEPGEIGPIDAGQAHHDDSYRTSARFLAYLIESYDPEIVRRLHEAMRSGKYSEDIFREATGKGLKELGDDWRATLAP